MNNLNDDDILNFFMETTSEENPPKVSDEVWLKTRASYKAKSFYIWNPVKMNIYYVGAIAFSFFLTLGIGVDYIHSKNKLNHEIILLKKQNEETHLSLIAFQDSLNNQQKLISEIKNSNYPSLEDKIIIDTIDNVYADKRIKTTNNPTLKINSSPQEKNYSYIPTATNKLDSVNTSFLTDLKSSENSSFNIDTALLETILTDSDEIAPVDKVSNLDSSLHTPVVIILKDTVVVYDTIKEPRRKKRIKK